MCRDRHVTTTMAGIEGAESSSQRTQRKIQAFTSVPSIGIYITSSTAQGGGGSFKNRKPIGEVGCCESGMAERSH
jgi:hypothetical protein